MASTTTASRTATPVASKSRHVDPTRRQQAVAAWVLAVPFMVLFLVFTAGPVLASLGMSFTDIRSTDMRSPFAVGFVGLENYTRLLGDPLFQKVMFNTFAYLVLGVPLTMGLALAAAVGLNRITFLRGLFRVGYYLPVVTSIVAVSVVWKFLLREEGGLLNAVLALVGVDGPGWLDSTTLALPSLVVMSSWRNLGALMIIFLAGLQTIPAEVIEAVRGGRRRRVAAVPPPHAADAQAHAAVRCGDHLDRLPPVLRGGVRDDQGRPARQHPLGHLLHLRPVRLRQLRAGRGRVVPAVPRGRGVHPDPVPVPRRAEGEVQ